MLKTRAFGLSQTIDEVKADVVAGVAVFVSRIAETDDESNGLLSNEA